MSFITRCGGLVRFSPKAAGQLRALTSLFDWILKEGSLKPYIFVSALWLFLAGCSEEVVSGGGDLESAFPAISIGGVTVNGNDVVSISLANTRAALTSDAVDSFLWLREPLKTGWDVVYWLKKDGYATHKIAKLQLNTTESGEIVRGIDNYPEYKFRYRSTAEESSWSKAQWLGNGTHEFRSEYVPTALYDPDALPADITTNQSADNYDFLSHYLSMGPECTVRSTLARANLPFIHRLARVKLFILINPNIKNDDGTQATIKGYQLVDGKDDPTTSGIRMSKVKVLKSVKKTDNVEVEGHSTLTPLWTEESEQIIPHFVGEFGSIDYNENVYSETNCVAYHNLVNDEYYAPGVDGWIYLTEPSGNDSIERIDYGLVPCYDLIVRPAYEYSEGVVFYDEEFEEYENNSMNIEITLSNGIVMKSSITFNLVANTQTTVHLFLNKEEVDYTESNSVAWNEEEGENAWFGVDNDNGLTLSKSGSSWQRAYRIGSASTDGNGDDVVTDGNFYDKDTEGDKEGAGQYLSEAEWKSYFQAATKGGEHHGDYFILDQDITLDGGITFTGHLDAQGHKITFTNALTGLDGVYSTAQEDDESADWEANVHKENGLWVPWKTTDFGYRAEIVNAQIVGDNFLPMSNGAYGATVTGYIVSCTKAGTDPVVTYPENVKYIPKYDE